ncbi:MAG TPA: hypothetical protein VN426_04055 [Syntrophomonadaceae bacterium]|nr:hypothetical protein [Syntrophomonadaceae bacterium]
MQSAIIKYGLSFIRSLLMLQKADLQANSQEYCARELPLLEDTITLYESATANYLFD